MKLVKIRLQKLAVDLVADALDRQSERQRTREDDASRQRSAERPATEDHRRDGDEAAAADDAGIEAADLHNDEKRPAKP